MNIPQSTLGARQTRTAGSIEAGFRRTRSSQFAAICAALMVLKSPSALADWSMNVNFVSAELLADALRGVVSARAYRIVVHREADGPLENIEELVGLHGIGQATV